MTHHQQAKPTSRFLWMIRGLLLVFTFYAGYEDVTEIGTLVDATHNVGYVGLRAHTIDPDRPGCSIIKSVDPNGAFPAAGIVRNDSVCLDYPIDFMRVILPGQSIPATVIHAGVARRVTIIAVGVPRIANLGNIVAGETLYALASLFSVLVGGFIIARSQRPSALLLGTAFVMFGESISVGAPWQNGRDVFTPWLIGTDAFSALMPALFLRFAMAFYEENVARLPAWSRMAVYGFALVYVGLTIVASWLNVHERLLPVIGTGYGILSAMMMAAFAMAVCVMIIGWHKSPPIARRRYALMLAGVTLILLSQTATSAAGTLNHNQSIDDPFLIASVILAVGGPLLMAYAILRHRVLDLGFVVNRAVVYAVLSFLMLVSFGIVEFLAEKFVPVEGRENNAFLDLAIALLLYLAFHHLKDYVERAVEKVFFAKWHHNEAALTRFAKAANVMERSDAVAAALIAELHRFTDGASAALYVRDGRGALRRAAGEPAIWGETLSEDERAIATAKAENEPIEPVEVFSDLQAALIVPMRPHNDLYGVVLLAAKSNGNPYRPDEKAALGRVIQQIGQDLNALRLEQLEDEVLSVKAKLKARDVKPRLAGQVRITAARVRRSGVAKRQP